MVYAAFLGCATAVAVGVSTDGLWYAIIVPVAPGGTGWVSATYVLPVNTAGLPVLPAAPVPPTVELIPPAQGDPQATTLTQTLIRTGPGDMYPAYDIAQTGATARVIGKSQDGLWWQVKVLTRYYYGGFGWVSVDWVYTANTGIVPVVAAPPLPITELPSTPPTTNATVLVSQNPQDHSAFPTSTGFGMTWTVKNTGTVAWDQNTTDLIYLGAINGQRLHQNGDVYDITATVNPGETYNVHGSLITPASPGE